MPELPEVETVVRGLRPHLVGRTLRQVEQRRPDLREKLPDNFVARLEGRRVTAVERRAKYILIHLDDATVLVVHLGMSGQLVLGAKPNAIGPHEHVSFTLDDGRVMRFTDPRRFGLMDIVPEDEFAANKRFRDLGPEPLGADFTGKILTERINGRKGPIKTTLLDQTIVAGLGNIYVCEALFAAGISPRRQAGRTARQADHLVEAIRDVLKSAIKAGGSSARDYVNANGEQGWFQARWKVYDHEGKPCPSCRATIKRLVQGGRSTFYCPKCQR